MFMKHPHSPKLVPSVNIPYVKLLSVAVSAQGPLTFSSPVCFLLKNDIKWNSISHRKWSGLLGEANIFWFSTKVQTPSIHFVKPLPISLHYQSFLLCSFQFGTSAGEQKKIKLRRLAKPGWSLGFSSHRSCGLEWGSASAPEPALSKLGRGPVSWLFWATIIMVGT